MEVEQRHDGPSHAEVRKMMKRHKARGASGGIPTISRLDSFRYALSQMLPNFLAGLFYPRRFWVGLLTRFHPDPLGVRIVSRLREKYGQPYLYIKLLRSKSLLVLDPDGIQRVLDNSPEVYGDPKTKRRGMAHFQPNAVTISRGADWDDRRRFNDAVLACPRGRHEFAGAFLKVIEEEVEAVTKSAATRLRWPDFERLFERIMLRIVFGSADRADFAASQRLRTLMRQSNRVRGLGRSRHFEPLYVRIRDHLSASRPNSLAALAARTPHSEITRAENQFPHWMFASRDTLAINTARTLALIAAHPAVGAKLTRELAGADLASPDGIEGLAYLEGCLQDAMRLWPTTPILARETLQQDDLNGHAVPAGTQVLILNGYNHRGGLDAERANRFSPDPWMNARADYRFNHFSNGRQSCAGKDLALFIAKAVLANLLKAHDYRLSRPALNPDEQIPHAFNYFRLILSREPWARTGSPPE